MTAVKDALIYATFGSGILFGCLKLFKVNVKAWEPMAACVAAGFCVLVLPNNLAGIASLFAMLGMLKFSTREPWNEIVYPVFVARLALIPVLFVVGRL